MFNNKINESRRSIKLKDIKKLIFPFMPLSYGLGCRQTSTFQELHIAVATYNCGTSSKSRIHSSANNLCIPPYKPSPYTSIMHHYPCLADIKTPFRQAVLYSTNPSFIQPTHWATTNTLSYIDPFNNPVILHSLHMAESLENNFINLFIYTLHHSIQLP